jgi:hypothetical protein
MGRGTHPFLYQVIGPVGVVAQAPLSVNITPQRLIYRGDPDYPAHCVDPLRAVRSTEPHASCLVAAVVNYYSGWPPPPPKASPRHTTTPPSTPASGRKCGGFLLGPDAIDLIEDVRAHGVSCSLARAVAKGSRLPGAPADARTRYRSHGFSCHGGVVIPPSRGKEHLYYRCTRGHKFVTFVHN